MTGRPTDYTPQLAEKICKAVATSSKGLRKLCNENEDFPSYATVFNWLADKDLKSFLDLYDSAKQEQADILADEILEIADDGNGDYLIGEDGKKVVNTENIQRSRLRVDARKWVAAKLKPKKYGEKVEIDQTNTGVIRVIYDDNQAETPSSGATANPE